MREYYEKQTISAPIIRWSYLIVTGISTIVAGGKLINEGKMEEFWLFVPGFTLFLAAVFYLVFLMPAEVKINRSGVHYRYKPWVRKWKTFKWSEIKSVEEKSIEPIGDYGGYGYRITLKGNKGIVMNAEKGVKFNLRKEKHFIFSTNQLEKMMKSVREFESVKH